MPIATTPLANLASTMFRSSNVLSDLQNLFSVEGLVAVVTGGGTGACIATTRRQGRSRDCQQPACKRSTLIDDLAQESGS